MTKNKLLLLLALLLTAATGAWAQGPYTVAGSNAAMFGFAWDPSNTANDMTKNGDGTYSITYTNVNFTEPEEVQYKVVKDHSWNEAYPEVNRVINIAKAGTYTLTIHFNPTTHEVYETMPGYTVTLADGTEEPTLWSASPATDVKKGQTVTVTYTGSKKVIGVKAEKKASAPASTPLDNTTTAWTAGPYAVPTGGLTYSDAITVSGDVTLTLTDGETLTLNKGISLAEGAKLTIQGNGAMVVNGSNNSTASTVAGTGTIVLTSGTLTAKGGNGASIDEDNAFSNGSAGGVAINGNVVVNGGTLTATGGNGGSVGFWSSYCNGGAGGAAISGDLTINSGTVTSTNGANGQLGEGTMDSSAGAGGKAVEGTVTDNR